MKTHPEERPVAEAAARLKAQLGATPEVAIVLGSGLSSVADAMAIEADATYAELGLPDTSVAGHNGHAYVGQLGGRRVIVLSGRVHFYEGQGMATVVRTTRAMHRWGVPTMMLTNSAGGIDREYVPGDLVLVRDHLNLLGESPLFGPAYGERFPDMTYAYDPDAAARHA